MEDADFTITEETNSVLSTLSFPVPDSTHDLDFIEQLKMIIERIIISNPVSINNIRMIRRSNLYSRREVSELILSKQIIEVLLMMIDSNPDQELLESLFSALFKLSENSEPICQRLESLHFFELFEHYFQSLSVSSVKLGLLILNNIIRLCKKFDQLLVTFILQLLMIDRKYDVYLSFIILTLSNTIENIDLDTTFAIVDTLLPITKLMIPSAKVCVFKAIHNIIDHRSELIYAVFNSIKGIVSSINLQPIYLISPILLLLGDYASVAKFDEVQNLLMNIPSSFYSNWSKDYLKELLNISFVVSERDMCKILFDLGTVSWILDNYEDFDNSNKLICCEILANCLNEEHDLVSPILSNVLSVFENALETDNERISNSICKSIGNLYLKLSQSNEQSILDDFMQNISELQNDQVHILIDSIKI